MKDYNQSLQEEKNYLSKTLLLIKKELELETSNLTERKNRLIASRRDMWESTAHHNSDFEKLTEMNQHLSEVTNQAVIHEKTRKRIERYRKMTSTPYFGRFDFIELDTDDIEKIYIGMNNLMESKTNDIYVYDWRAPVSSIFYRFEPGSANYSSPVGLISGEVLLKRQYKIKDSELKYFFDCSLTINDEILKDVLGRNSSIKMRTIVETIQKEQDIVIRDTDNEILIVQGAAGSGKTSIALHRIAFLLYRGLSSKLYSNNIIIISPNTVFSKYISDVLPEMGEENVRQITMEDIFDICFDGTVSIESRNTRIESIISCRENKKRKFLRLCLEFKGSRVFITLLDRLLWCFEHRLLEFEDIYYEGMVLESRQLLKNSLLKDKVGIPLAKRLKRLENKILEEIRPYQKRRLAKLEEIVQAADGHEFEIRSFGRLLSIKNTKTFRKRLQNFTEVDCLKLYKMLFMNRKLFFELAKGLVLPESIDEIINATIDCFERESMPYEDAVALLYLKLKVEGNNSFSEIKQVVIDEAQDYYPLHYKIFKDLFTDVRYTIVGDVSQTIEKEPDVSYYDDIADILNKNKTANVFLKKSYRSSYEINKYTQRLLEEKQEVDFFERHEVEPEIVYKQTSELIDRSIIDDILRFKEQGFESIAVICKTAQEAEELYSRLIISLKVTLVMGLNSEIEEGIMVMPVYISRGLEFDAVLVYGADKHNYSEKLDKKLLYIACTRALHRLNIYYTGEKSPYI